MISIIKYITEVEINPGDFKYPYELIRFARKKKLLPVNPNNKKPESEDGFYNIPYKDKSNLNPIYNSADSA